LGVWSAVGDLHSSRGPCPPCRPRCDRSAWPMRFPPAMTTSPNNPDNPRTLPGRAQRRRMAQVRHAAAPKRRKSEIGDLRRRTSWPGSGPIPTHVQPGSAPDSTQRVLRRTSARPAAGSQRLAECHLSFMRVLLSPSPLPPVWRRLFSPSAGRRKRPGMERHAESGVTWRRRECRTVPRRSVRDRSRQWTLTVGPLGDRARGHAVGSLSWRSPTSAAVNGHGGGVRAIVRALTSALGVPWRSSGLGPRACSPRTCWLGPGSTARYSNALTKAPCGPGPERA
jgi:hypothetical protein